MGAGARAGGRASTCLLCLLLPALVASSAAAPSGADGPDDDFTVIIQPDTQSQVTSDVHAESLMAAVRWVCDRRDALDIRAFLTLGDLVANGRQAEQWARWRAAMDVLKGCEVPVLAVVGNHDFPCNPERPRGCGPGEVGAEHNYLGDASDFLAQTRAVMDASEGVWWKARSPELEEPACTRVEQPGRSAWIRFHPKWAAIALPWNDADGEGAYTGVGRATHCQGQYDWAQGVAAANPDLNFIVLSHRWTRREGTLPPLTAFLREVPNAPAAAGGHWLDNPRFGTHDERIGGRNRAILWANFQNNKPKAGYFGGLVVMTIRGGEPTDQICYRSYSPWKDAWDLHRMDGSCHTVDLE